MRYCHQLSRLCQIRLKSGRVIMVCNRAPLSSSSGIPGRFFCITPKNNTPESIFFPVFKDITGSAVKMPANGVQGRKPYCLCFSRL